MVKVSFSLIDFYDLTKVKANEIVGELMKYYYFKMEKKEEIDSAVKKCQEAEIRLKNKKSEWDRKKRKYDEIRLRKEKEKKRYNELMDGINDTLTKVSTIRDARI